jgi:replicative superfamily II helicase
MTWTYFFRRLLQNPTYYGLEAVGQADLNSYLTALVGKCLDELELSYCVERDDEERDGGRGLYPTVLGRIASYYYLAHQTVQHFRDSLQPEMTSAQVLQASVRLSFSLDSRTNCNELSVSWILNCFIFIFFQCFLSVFLQQKII